MKQKRGIVLFGAIEILIGSITLIGVIASLVLGKSDKPAQALIFVLTSAFISAGLGLGIFRRNLICYYLLLYFSSTIILSKILIFAKIITLNGALETTVPSSLKNTISILYHSLLIYYFIRRPIREQFKK